MEAKITEAPIMGVAKSFLAKADIFVLGVLLTVAVAAAKERVQMSQWQAVLWRVVVVLAGVIGYYAIEYPTQYVRCLFTRDRRFA
jgi:hypothetical protein